MPLGALVRMSLTMLIAVQICIPSSMRYTLRIGYTGIKYTLHVWYTDTVSLPWYADAMQGKVDCVYFITHVMQQTDLLPCNICLHSAARHVDVGVFLYSQTARLRMMSGVVMVVKKVNGIVAIYDIS